MIKYGLISELDGETLEKTIDLICDEFKEDKIINITEVGLFDCGTADGIFEYLWNKKRSDSKHDFYGISYIGIDNEKDKKIDAPTWMTYIKGYSNEVYNQIEGNSQHLIFIDACHCFAHVISDFYCYCDKVKVGGYLAFHDTGKHIKPFKDFQHGDKDNPDAYISVRKALEKLGLFFENVSFETYMDRQWDLIFDEADRTDEAGGITVFKKLY